MDSLCTAYPDEPGALYHNMVSDMKNYDHEKKHTKPADNFFIVSCLPRVHYSSFTVSNESEYPFLFPMIAWGKYDELGGKMVMPVTLQIRHAVADGYHCAKFYADVETVIRQLAQLRILAMPASIGIFRRKVDLYS